MSYSQVTMGQLSTELARRLADANGVFWSDAERQSYIAEGLHLWQALTGSYVKTITYQSDPFNQYYDVFSHADLAPSVTDQDLIIQIQRHLLEAENATGWSGTSQFTYNAVVSALQRRLSQFFIETGIRKSVSTVTGPTAGVLTLDQGVIDVDRLTWISNEATDYGYMTKLWRADPTEVTAYSQSWKATGGFPDTYILFPQTPLAVRITPLPNVSGQVQLHTINSGPTLNPSAGATVLTVPDDYAWIIKYGALADLFGEDGPGMDPNRAKYCLQRWNEGLTLARMAAFVRFGYLNDTPTLPTSLEDLDNYAYSWFNGRVTPPDSLDYLGASGNLLTVVPWPTEAITVTLDATVNFPIPASGEYLPVGQELIDPLMGYALHIAMLKEGGSEFGGSTDWYTGLVRLAATQNDRLKAQAQQFQALSTLYNRQYRRHPRRFSDPMVPSLGDK